MSIGASIGSYIKGDKNPTDFKFSDYLSPKDVLTLYITSDPVHKMAYWLPSQALAAGWIFDVEEKFNGFKHDKPFLFKTFDAWFRWSKAREELLKGMSWSILFSKSLLCGFCADEDPTPDAAGKIVYGEKPADKPITKWMAVWAYTNGLGPNGYKIDSVDENGDPEVYAIHYSNKDIDLYEDTAKDDSEHIFLIHKSRCVPLHYISKEMGRDGTSGAQLIAHLALVQREMTRSVFSICKNLEAGVMVARANNTADATMIQTNCHETLSHLDLMLYTGNKPLNDLFQLVVPEMKVQQFSELNLNLNKALASSIGISIRSLGEEDIATGLGDVGGEISHAMTKFQIKDLQQLYQRPIEEMIYLMGKEDSSFTWNEPFVKDEQLQQDQTQKKADLSRAPNTGSSDGKTEDDPNNKDVENNGSDTPNTD